MKKIFFIPITCLMASCSVLTSKSTKTISINHSGVIQTPVIVDIYVEGDKISGSASGRINVEILKQEAIADAIEKATADVLVEPSFKTKTTFRTTVVNVTGYPGYYKNFRNIQADDLKLIDNTNTKTAQVEKNITVKKKRGKGVIIGVTIGVVLYALALILSL
jgi:lipoate-protein ligase A